jgi:two-component system, NtrC family, sensor kinase
MKLTLKVTVALGLLIAIVLGFSGYLRVQREATLFDSDMRQDHLHLGHALRRVIEHVWSRVGEQRAMALVGSAHSARQSLVRLRSDELSVGWVSLDPGQGSPLDAAERERLRSGQEVSKRVAGSPGTLFTYVPLSPRNAGLALEISESLAAAERYTRTTVYGTVATTGLLLLGCAGAALVIGLLMVGHPTRRLVDKARRIGAGDLSGPLVLRQKDELRVLADEMNSMCDQLAEARRLVDVETASRLAALEQLRHADRLMTVGKLASGIAHELGTPLAVVAGRAQMIGSGEAEGAEARENAKTIGEQVQRMTKIIRQLLDFARRETPHRASVDVRAVIERSLALLQTIALKQEVALHLVEGEPATTQIDEGQILQALTNLIVNAIQASSRGGAVTVRIDAARARPPADQGGTEVAVLRLEISDGGVGMDTATIERIFEPFFTTKGVGEGTGLGLSVTYGIVREHGGWIEVRSQPGAGSTFIIYLPRCGD